jgi:hypothetical protein
MNKIKTIMTFLAIGIVALNINASAQTTIQKTFIKKADFNLDGKLEEVQLIIYGENIKKPFKWELSVKMGEQIIYHHTCDDSWLDDFFNDPHYYSDNGEPYEVQKTNYYFKDLPEGIVGKAKISEETWSKDDYRLKKYIESNIQDELKTEYNITGEKVQTIIKAAISRLTQGVDTLSISCNPQTGSIQLIFIPEINSFVMYSAP